MCAVLQSMIFWLNIQSILNRRAQTVFHVFGLAFEH